MTSQTYCDVCSNFQCDDTDFLISRKLRAVYQIKVVDTFKRPHDLDELKKIVFHAFKRPHVWEELKNIVNVKLILTYRSY